MSRSLAGARERMRHGTALFIGLTDLGASALAEPSALPGWTRKHVIAHIAANADCRPGSERTHDEHQP